MQIPNLNQLTNLKFLSLACNQITSIDINIYKLKELYLNVNQLTHVNFNTLTGLKYLNLYNNPIINFTNENQDLLLVI
jgi:Leucine-rich repeat (LRR) protein